MNESGIAAAASNKNQVLTGYCDAIPIRIEANQLKIYVPEVVQCYFFGNFDKRSRREIPITVEGSSEVHGNINYKKQIRDVVENDDSIHNRRR
jgi:hypothetical protein